MLFVIPSRSLPLCLCLEDPTILCYLFVVKANFSHVVRRFRGPERGEWKGTEIKNRVLEAGGWGIISKKGLR